MILNDYQFSVSPATFNVQKFSFQTTGNKTLQLTCHFAKKSFADGCYVRMISKDSNRNFSIHKTPENMQKAVIDVAEIANGKYDFLVYDGANKPESFIDPAVTTSYSVSFPSTSTTTTGLLLEMFIGR